MRILVLQIFSTPYLQCGSGRSPHPKRALYPYKRFPQTHIFSFGFSLLKNWLLRCIWRYTLKPASLPLATDRISQISLSDLPPSPEPSKTFMASPPPGVTPNPKNSDPSARTLYVVSAVCLAVTFCFVGARMYSKLYVVKKRTMDDCKLNRSAFCVTTDKPS